MAKIKGTNSDDRIVPSGSTPPAGKKKDDVSVPLAADTITRGNDRDTINNTKGIIVSFGNTPQAKDDLFTPADLTEGSLGTVILDVMGNDLGGAAKRLWSLDDGTSPGGIRPTDLLTQDPVGAANVSANGATIKITTDGKVSYDASTLSSAFTNNLQTLGAGEFATDTFTYAIRLANGALSWATATVQIAGTTQPLPAPTVAIADGLPNSQTEGAGNITFTVSLTGPADEDTLVTYSTVNGSAVAGTDFTGATGATVTILAGATTATITIPVLNDAVFETPEAFTVVLASASLTTSAVALTITDASVIGNIVDNDAAPAFSINDGKRKGDRLLFWGFSWTPALAQRGLQVQGGRGHCLPVCCPEGLLSIHTGVQGGEFMVEERLIDPLEPAGRGVSTGAGSRRCGNRRLDQGQSIACSTSPARTGLRST